eukprot:1228486-Rhodomonas_salina.1
MYLHWLDAFRKSLGAMLLLWIILMALDLEIEQGKFLPLVHGEEVDDMGKHTAAFKEHGQQRIPAQRAGTLEVPEEEEFDVTVGDMTPEAMGSDGQVDLSIDFAHTILTSQNKEKYYLVIVAHCVEFTWASQARTGNALRCTFSSFWT